MGTLDEKTVKFLERHAGLLSAYVVPGLAVMDYGFGRGLYFSGIDNLYQFILLLTWSISLSIPLVVVVAITLRPHELHGESDPYGQSVAVTANISMLFVFLLVFIHYMLFNTINHYFSYELDAFVALDTRVSVFVVAGVATVFLAFPLASMYRSWISTVRSRMRFDRGRGED